MPDGQFKALIDQQQTLKNIVCTSCDDFTGNGLEFEAVVLSLYGRNTK